MERLAYIKKTLKKHTDETRIVNPDSRRNVRRRVVTNPQINFARALRADPTTDPGYEKGEYDSDFVVTGEDVEGSAGSTTGSGEDEEGGQTTDEQQAEEPGTSKAKKKRSRRRARKYATRVPQQEVEELAATAGDAAPTLSDTRPPLIGMKEAYRRLGVAKENEKHYYQEALALVAEQQAIVRNWDHHKATTRVQMARKGAGGRTYNPRSAKNLVQPGHYALMDPTDPEVREQLNLDQRIESLRETGVPQDTTVHARSEVRIRRTRVKPKKKPRPAPGEKKYADKKAKELAMIQRHEERAALALRLQKEEFPMFTPAECEEMLLAGETDSTSDSEFETTLQVGVGVPYIPPTVPAQEQAGPSSAPSKHRYDDEPDEVIRVKAAKLIQDLDLDTSSCEDVTPEDSQQDLGDAGSSTPSSHDRASPDLSIKSVELPSPSSDSQAGFLVGDTSDEDTDAEEDKQDDAAGGEASAVKSAPASAPPAPQGRGEQQEQQPPAQQPLPRLEEQQLSQQEPPSSPPAKRPRRSSRQRARKAKGEAQAPAAEPTPSASRRAQRKRKSRK